ncbi:MAG TPA: hypothetical protein DCX32_01245 [Candidatus Moranbacteria bacterium]|nr:MAG: hypothetical protein UW87_C0020G0009 [Candidatus Moranbacteria bacterium GW2011_GWC2_45_10]KKT94816.1 MAG: hypothetical protein UW95_C0008G0025 [Parcubacteria group bacterium GW2011_GWC1_45_14]HAV11154.1 hypothetical protein [Candidatus Moranbacteria bacterium]
MPKTFDAVAIANEVIVRANHHNQDGDILKALHQVIRKKEDYSDLRHSGDLILHEIGRILNQKNNSAGVQLSA